MATIQARRAIEKMKKAGFARSDFRVRTNTKVFQRTDMLQGTRTYREYGDAIITCLASKEESTSKIEAALDAGLDVTVYYINGQPGHPHFSEAAGDKGDVVCKTPARMNLHYGELELDEPSASKGE